MLYPRMLWLLSATHDSNADLLQKCPLAHGYKRRGAQIAKVQAYAQ